MSAPLSGRINYTPARGATTSFTNVGTIGGAVAGFPADTYLLTQWIDTTVKPSRIVNETSSRTDAHGAQRFDAPLFMNATAHVSNVIFKVGTNDRDARQYGPSAHPC